MMENNTIKNNEKNELQLFTSEQFGQIRIIVINGENIFNLYDVCFGLGYTKSDGRKLYLRKDNIENICETLDIKGLSLDDRDSFAILKDIDFENTYITEDAFYDLCLESKAKHARPFRKWVTTDVLPSINKHGAYMTEEIIEKTLTDPDFIIQLATQLKEERIKRIQAENKIEEQKPLVGFAETCLKSKDNILVRQVSKIAQDEGIDIGEKKLYKKLREWGLILTSSTEPSQRGMNSLYFVVEEKSIDTPYGVKLSRITKVSPKGQVFIIEKLKKELLE